MALRRAAAGEIVDLQPFGPNLKEAGTAAIVKTDRFEAIRLVVRAGTEIARHQVPGPITLHCLEGRVRLGLESSALELAAGQWLFLEGGAPHSVTGIEDSALLLTILFEPPARPADHANDQRQASSASATQALDARLDEALMDTFPASDPVALSNPTTGISKTPRRR